MTKPRLGLALGSGAAKGFAHIGVLKALTEHGIEPDVITGSSMGSLIGAFYVTGMRPAFMDRLACTVKWRHWLDVTVPRVGLVAGEKIHQMIVMLTRGLEFRQVSLPFGVVATDLAARESVLITEGKLADAVRASISIPGVFVPMVMGDRVLVDGGVLERVPIEAARKLGADVVVAVDVGAIQHNHVPETIMDVIMQSLELMQQQVNWQLAGRADVYIAPDVSEVSASQFNKAREAIDQGYQATLSAIPEIQSLLGIDASSRDQTLPQ